MFNWSNGNSFNWGNGASVCLGGDLQPSTEPYVWRLLDPRYQSGIRPL